MILIIIILKERYRWLPLCKCPLDACLGSRWPLCVTGLHDKHSIGLLSPGSLMCSLERVRYMYFRLIEKASIGLGIV